MNDSRPEPDENGMIPCNCCRHGYRKDMQTKLKYLCNYCLGTNLREAPISYKSQKQLEAEALNDSPILNGIERELVEALEKAVLMASDENNEVFNGDLNARETALIKWKQSAEKTIAKAKGRAS